MFNLFKKKSNHHNDWKEKAKRRRLEVDSLKKRILELERSRDQWKSKASKLKSKNKKINDYLKKNF